MIQLGGFPGRLLGPLLKTGLLLIKNMTKSSAKSLLVPLELTAAASEADAGTQKIKNLEQQHYQYQIIKLKTLLK